jgi:hypothetical protein
MGNAGISDGGRTLVASGAPMGGGMSAIAGCAGILLLRCVLLRESSVSLQVPSKNLRNGF